MTWELLALAGLGAYHGLNPAMGWLFAVSRGMQERSRRAVIGSLGPIAAGHGLSLALVALVVLGAGAAVGRTALQIGAAAALVAFGVFRWLKPRAHFRWTKMRVSGRELFAWSFLMSTAHGAGLMLAPLLIGVGSAESAAAADHDPVSHGVTSSSSVALDAAGVALHVGAMLLVMGVVAVFVYEKVGLGVLRRAWLNTERLWAGAFVFAAAATLIS